MHFVQPGQRVRVLTVQLALPADLPMSDVWDIILNLLEPAQEEHGLLDWRHTPAQFVVTAGPAPQETDVFANVPDLLLPKEEHRSVGTDPVVYQVIPLEDTA